MLLVFPSSHQLHNQMKKASDSLLLILISYLQRKHTVYLHKSMGERSNLGKRASLGWADGVLLFSVGLAVRITMIHVLAIGAGVREALEALGTLEGLFAAVQSFVFSQMMLVLERSWTLQTFVGPLPWNIYQLLISVLFVVTRNKLFLRK